MNQTPRYCTMYYDARKALDVSIAEYFYLDMVHKLSYNRWCIKSVQNCADDMGISKRGLLKIRDRLVEQGYLKKNIKGHTKVTDEYINIAVNKVHKSVNKVHPTGEQSAHKNNKRYTENRNNQYKTPAQMGMPEL